MNSSKSAKYSQGEAKTRAPIHYEWNLTNWIYSSSHDPQAFLKFLQSLEENPPEVMAGSIFAGVVPFDWGIRGAIMGQADPILGGGAGENPDLRMGFGRLPPGQLQQRIALIEQYIEDLHSLGKVERVMPYMDFGTQLFGRHNRPTDVPESVKGIWEFYDHWEEYAEPPLSTYRRARKQETRE